MESKEEKVAYHRGALTVLLKEQEAFMQMMNVVRQFIKAHIDALKELGVDFEAEIKEAQKAAEQQKTEGKGIDERLS